MSCSIKKIYEPDIIDEFIVTTLFDMESQEPDKNELNNYVNNKKMYSFVSDLNLVIHYSVE